MQHVALVVDNSAANADAGGGRTSSIYVNGALVAQSTPNMPNALSGVDDTNNWLGRSLRENGPSTMRATSPPSTKSLDGREPLYVPAMSAARRGSIAYLCSGRVAPA